MIEVTDTIQTKPRKPAKKGGARQLRASGMVPAVAYGPSREPRVLAVDPHQFVLQRRKYGRSHLYEVSVDGGDSFKAVIKEIHRHPVSRAVLHVDFYEVDPAKPIRISVRIDLIGRPVGVVAGGVLTQLLRRVELRGLPAHIPDYLQVDVSNLQVGHTAHISDLKLPEGVRTTALRDAAIATVVEPLAKEEATGQPAAEGAAEAVGEAGGTAAQTPEGKA